MDVIDTVRRAWEEGKPILLFDSEDREGEVDIMLPSIKMTPEIITEMRENAGGLVCCALSSEYCKAIGLPFLTEIFEKTSGVYPVLGKMLEHGLPYGARSAFSVSINHVDSFTGITDIDRSLTIIEIGRLGEEDMTDGFVDRFTKNFRIPGHVPLLRGADGLLKSRLGHTELGLALCEMTGFSPSVTMCEMMDGKTGKALPTEEARTYAEKRGYVFLDGAAVIDAWVKFKGIDRSQIFRRS